MIKVRARGLEGFRHDLEVAEDRFVDGVRELETSLADDAASGARSNARKGKRSGTALESIKAQGNVVSAGVGVVYYGFADFGGRVGEGRRIHRPYIKGGRWLFPAVRDLQVGKRADAVIDKSTAGLQ